MPFLGRRGTFLAPSLFGSFRGEARLQCRDQVNPSPHVCFCTPCPLKLRSIAYSSYHSLNRMRSPKSEPTTVCDTGFADFLERQVSNAQVTEEVEVREEVEVKEEHEDHLMQTSKC
jgi:hypothetical protein